MDYFQRFVAQFRQRIFVLLFVNNLIILADWYLADQVFKLTGQWLLVILLVIPLLSLSVLPWLTARYLTEPTKLLWQAILHLVPDTSSIPAPKLENVKLGRELVTHLTNNVYQLAIDGARLATNIDREATDLHHNEIATKLPVPLLTLDAKATISFANPAALRYFQITEADIVGKDFYTLLDPAFSSSDTFDSWYKQIRETAVSGTHNWQRVRITTTNNTVLQFDLAANYSKADPAGHEVMLALFDRTAAYAQDDQGLSFIALAVHELRTPLSLLLGYIELFEEDLGDSLTPELKRFMFQMKSAGQNLAVFVSNVLTVARIESNQLELRLAEEDWGAIVSQAVEEMRLRAQVRGVSIELHLPASLPKVGANAIGANEVITNLIDNAIKYSQNSDIKKIIVQAAINREGFVETTIQDFGVGIPTNVMPSLFEKFHRSHRNRAQISGTGLGLYLARTIVEAHGGQIWVRSKEGQGATFSFTVQPYASLASELKNSNNTDIVHSAHGWVKNHSLYRR
jgi:signal transduction histidine kinase